MSKHGFATSYSKGNAAKTAAISVRGLVKTYSGRQQIRAVDGIDLDVYEGEVFGLLGPNGAGKTTTVGACTTRVKPSDGQVWIAGVSASSDPAWVKRSIGVVTQSNTLDRSCTVFENLYFHCRFFGMRRRESWERAEQLLEEFKLSERPKARPDELSGGMARRLQVARAIAHRPRVLFLDEPTAGLDPQSRIALWEAVREMGRREKLTVLLTTHHMEEADELCERVAIIDHGRILVCDAPANLKRSVGAGTVVEVRLQGDARGFSEEITQTEGILSTDAGEDVVRVFAKRAEGLLPRIVEVAQRYGLQDVSVAEPTLETVFIELTGRDLRD